MTYAESTELGENSGRWSSDPAEGWTYSNPEVVTIAHPCGGEE